MRKSGVPGEGLGAAYRGGKGSVRRDFAGSEAAAEPYYRRYVDFVSRCCPAEGGHRRLLELGCGAGWSSAILAGRGYEVTAADLDGRAFEPPPGERLRFAVASALSIPFADGVFDGVTSYQMLEHVPEPGAALAEMVRVVRPGGVVMVAGPNLMALGNSARNVLTVLRQNRPPRRILWADEGMPRYPFGRTLPETLLTMAGKAWWLVSRTWDREARFLPREPDLRPPFRGDSDACTLLNPIDVARHLGRLGCEVFQVGAPGRPRWTAPLAGGTWVAVRKGR